MQRAVPLSLSSNIFSHFAVSSEKKSPLQITAAQLTRMSRRPSSSMTRCNTARTAASSLRSAGAASTRPCALALACVAISAQAAALRSGSWLTRTTCAPSAASSAAQALPIPRLAPVTIATRPERPRSTGLPGIFQNVHAGAGAVDQINPPVLIGADVVRLDGVLAVGEFRHIAADFLRPQHVAHIDRAQPGVEIGEEHDVGPRSFGSDVFQDVVSPEAARPVEVFVPVRKERRDRNGVGLVARIDDPHELAVPVLLPGAGLVGDDEIRLVPNRPAGVGGPREWRRPLHMADKLHVVQIGAVDDRDAAAPPRAIHAVAADHRRAVERDGAFGRHRIVALPRTFGLLPRQAPDADDFGLERLADIERPDHPLVPSGRVIGQEGKAALVVDAEAMRAAAGRVEEADFARLVGLADVEDEEAGAGVLAFVAGQPFGVHVEMMVADDAHFVTMDAGWGAELVDFFRIARIAHVMRRKTFRPVIARAADRTHIGVALVNLDDAAAAPGGAAIMPEQFETPGFLGLA